jgi:hypothetical protein
MMALKTAIATPLMISMLGCTSPVASLRGAAPGAREDIYVLRSVREERVAKSTWCSQERAGFAPFKSEFLVDDRFSFWSIQTDPGEGKIIDARAKEVGHIRACYGLTADPRSFNFYGEGQVGKLSFAGTGDCLIVRTDYPEKGITTFRCMLNLRGLPSPYTGGLLATNTVGSRAMLGAETDPPGFVQSSIATIRLWRDR